MRKLILVAAFVLVALCPCLGQERNEIPMYGGIPPTPEQAKADQELIDYITKTLGSREAGAKDAVRLGFKYLARGDWSTAMKRFNQAWLLNGESAEVFWGFGAALSYQGKFGDSEKYFLRAIALNPRNGRIINDFGFMYQFWGTKGTKNKTERERYLDRSIELFERASQLEASHARIYFNWAVSLYFKQDYGGAWEKIKEAESTDARAVEQKFTRDLSKKMPRP